MGFHDRTESDGVATLGQGECAGPSKGGVVETCVLTREGDISGGNHYGSTLGPGRISSGRNTRKRRGGSDDRFEKIETFLMTYPTTPMNACVNTVPWLEDDWLKYIREKDPDLDTVIDMVKAKVCTWNYYDFKLLYERHSTIPLFNSTSTDTNSIYYSVEDSLSILIRFLEFQFHSNENIVEFLNVLFAVCERQIAKLNSILVMGPPSSGKNFFFDMVLCFYWNKGQIGNPNKYNNFAYQEAAGKRILMWNEPNYESRETDTIKMMLGGDSYTVKVKFKQDVSINRTPVIILTNEVVPFMSDHTFADLSLIHI